MRKVTGATNHQYGFSLMEILVAIALFAFGSLGLAKLQVNAQQTSHQQYLRNIAMQLVQDMAGRLRANKTAVYAGDYGFDEQVSYPDCFETDCSAQELAQFDTQQWRDEVQQSLPNAMIESELDGDTFRLSVYWYHPLPDVACLVNEEATANNCVQLEIVL